MGFFVGFLKLFIYFLKLSNPNLLIENYALLEPLRNSKRIKLELILIPRSFENSIALFFLSFSL